jgi:class 3 adenylate cyclase
MADAATKARATGHADLLILLAACACAVAAQLLQAVSPYSDVVSAPTVAIGSARSLLGVVLGLIIRRQRPGNAVGPILIVLAFAGWIPTIEFIPDPPPWTLSNALRAVSLPILAHLYVAFPGTRPLRGSDRRLVVFAYGFWLAASLSALAFFDSADPSVCTGCPANLFLMVPNEQLSEFIRVAANVVGVALALAVAWRIRLHWAIASEAVRRAMVPALVAAPIALIDAIVYLFGSTIASGAFVAVLNGPFYQLVGLVQPFAFLAGVLRTQLDRSGVGGLLTDIGGAPGLGSMEAALRRTLHDRSIQLFAWSDGARAWVDTDGAVHSLPTPSDSVAVTQIEHIGAPLAAVVHDPALGDEPALMSAATAALRLALENQRLTATVSAQAEMANSLPKGRVTLLYADIEGSTNLLGRLGDLYADLLFQERGLIRGTVRAHHGREVDARADEFFAVFPDAGDAAAAAIAIVRGVRTQAWPGGVELRVRIGLHTGEPGLTPQGYVGLDVHRVARIGNAGHGGQIVLSSATAAAIQAALPDDAQLGQLGRMQLRGFPEPDDLYQLSAMDLPSTFPPLRLPSEPAVDAGLSTGEAGTS